MSKKSKLKDLINKNFSEIDVKNIDFFHDNVSIFVSQKDYKKACELSNQDCFIESDYNVVVKIEYDLVPAEVGNFVLTGSAHSGRLSLAIVTNKWESNNITKYRCRHIIPMVDNEFARNKLRDDNFEITDDDFSGFQEGFVEVIDKEQAIQHLLNDVDESYENAKEKLERYFKNQKKQAPDLINSLVDGAVIENRQTLVVDTSKVDHVSYLDIPDDMKVD